MTIFHSLPSYTRRGYKNKIIINKISYFDFLNNDIIECYVQ